jgi:hypothetical protein
MVNMKMVDAIFDLIKLVGEKKARNILGHFESEWNLSLSDIADELGLYGVDDEDMVEISELLYVIINEG